MNSMLKPALVFVAFGTLVSWWASGTSNVAEMAAKSSNGKSHAARRHNPPSGDVAVQRTAGGHFSVEADINGTGIQMVVDTGASMVVLTEADAEDIGLKTDSLSYDASIQTANGSTSAAVVTLDEVRVGSIVRSNVRAMVTRDLSVSLLGMTFLNSLSEVSMGSNELVLKD
jgi:aspartyl protease family protein